MMGPQFKTGLDQNGLTGLIANGSVWSNPLGMIDPVRSRKMMEFLSIIPPRLEQIELIYILTHTYSAPTSSLFQGLLLFLSQQLSLNQFPPLS